MFEKLKAGLNGLVQKITTTELKAEKLQPVLSDFQLSLIQNDVAVPVAEHICQEMGNRLEGVQVKRLQDRKELVKRNLREVLLEILSAQEKIDLLKEIKRKRKINKPYTIVFVGINGTGKCVSGDVLIPLADGRIKPIREIYNEAAYLGKEKLADGGYIVENPKIMVYSVNPDTLKIEPKEPSLIWKLRSTEDLIKVTFQNGLTIKTTLEHPFFVITNDGVIAKTKAVSLRHGDYVMAPALLPDIDGPRRINLVDYSIKRLAGDPKFFLGPREVVEDIYGFLKKKFGSLRNAWLTLKIDRSFITFAYFWPRNGFIPINVVRKICKEYGYKIQRDYHKFLIKYGRSKPIPLPDLDNNFLEFLGFVYSEGHLGDRYVEVTNSQIDYLKDYRHLAKILFPNLHNSMSADKRKANLWKVITNSKTLVEFLRYLFNFPVGRKGTRLTIPDIICQQPTSALKGFLIRYFDGDSYIPKDQRYVEITTASKGLQKTLLTILLRYGIASGVGEREVSGTKYYRLWMSGQEKFKRFFERIGSKNLNKIGRITRDINLTPQFELTELVPNIGSLIKLTRNSVKLTQKDVARKLKTSQSLLSMYETRGVRIPKKKLRLFVKLISSRTSTNNNAKNVLKYLKTLAFSDIYWLKVEKVQRSFSPAYVYDLTVDGHHNFIANNLIVHNTTTIAKVANLLTQDGYSVVLACSDTYRAGSIEQLQEHADRLGVRMVKHKYGADPTAVAYDAVKHAESRGVDVVLIDTAGRIQTDRNLMNELAKIKRVIHPDLTVLTVDALTGNDAVMQAEEFHKTVGIDGTILTKVDADVKGGSALSVTYVTGKPIVFIGTGQKYEDLQEFDAEHFTQMILS